MPYTFLSSSLISLLGLTPEMRKFAYSGIRREDCEGTLFYSPLVESRVAASRLTSVRFCALLDCLDRWLCHGCYDPSLVEGLGVSELTYIPFNGSGSSVMPLGEAWVSDYIGRYWGPGYS